MEWQRVEWQRLADAQGQVNLDPPPHHLVLTAKKGRQTNLDAPIWLMSRAELINFKGFNVKSVA